MESGNNLSGVSPASIGGRNAKAFLNCVTAPLRLQVQACADNPAAGEARGFSLRDAHGGNAVRIRVLRRLRVRDKSVSFGEYPGPIVGVDASLTQWSRSSEGIPPLRMLHKDFARMPSGHQFQYITSI